MGGVGEHSVLGNLLITFLKLPSISFPNYIFLYKI